MKQFKSIDLREFEGFEHQGPDDTWGTWRSYVTVGLVFYAVDVYNTSTGKRITKGLAEPARKNLSNEPCVDGWCGTTNNVDVEAIGRWRIVRVKPVSEGIYDVDAESVA